MNLLMALCCRIYFPILTDCRTMPIKYGYLKVINFAKKKKKKKKKITFSRCQWNRKYLFRAWMKIFSDSQSSEVFDGTLLLLWVYCLTSKLKMLVLSYSTFKQRNVTVCNRCHRRPLKLNFDPWLWPWPWARNPKFRKCLTFIKFYLSLKFDEIHYSSFESVWRHSMTSDPCLWHSWT